MSWYDYIPGVSNAAGIIKGDPLQAIGGPARPLYDTLYGDPANEVKAAYDAAMGKSQESGMRIKDFLMGQQQEALGKYAPVKGMFQNMYGSQGLSPQQLPGRGGVR